MAIATINPTTGVTEREFDPHTDAEIDKRIAHAHAAYRSMRATSYADRADWMRAAADILESELDEAARMLTTEMGKTIAQARAEVLKSAKAMRFYADNAEEFLTGRDLADPSAVNASAAYTRYEPLGVVLAIMPWNYPLWQVIRFAAPALMAGNAGLLKHASNVPQAALYLDTLFERGGFPTGAFRSLLIPARAVEAVLRDRRVAAATLTGSEPAGRSVASIAGSEVKHVVLELGGSDPFIVMPSADIDGAVATAVTSRTVNNGQACINAKRFIVHRDVYDEFVGKFTAAMAALRVGDPMDDATDVGPLATASGRDDIVELVEDALAKGAVATTGGAVTEGAGWFYPPTVLSGITPEMRLYAEEAFGPVASVYRVDSAAEAVEIANDTTFGLSSAVWTRDEDEEAYLVRSIDAGAVFINGMSISYPELPFGGIKDSGVGRELSVEGIREFCNLKSVWKA
ncbi:succinate-semialdehyde dehydrogenase/glutarate-semialdehyde dehydrogenase [Microcella putealis]|uniref:Succinate-semialdehyde dehydrogenase/glutarate-semialdehyde dehydrogenase n=1 Tax=Microcella putealis TaxID=337005 RepID=A0A4Q7LTE3_9MICO|nr:NADP-dependent succinic semialdehyde dehydrogenase [Microcella putealis]RZS57318.1 succinate-semialdehyde dehydrogenase/glutarate-semialdehyde dehydrogenase [Microcella putealis]TQM19539.1 succinate-semialdehyde dehydrogenase/glutarate-semialdehyde dehydrogenase [Microcella putealis]